MSRVLLSSGPNLAVWLDPLEDYLYADWVGQQTEGSVREGCDTILRLLAAHKSAKLLNDNTRVTGMWSDAAEWVALDWIPRMHVAGCRFLAHVYSPDVYARLSADKAVSYGLRGVLVATFQERQIAEAWLRAM